MFKINTHIMFQVYNLLKLQARQMEQCREEVDNILRDCIDTTLMLEVKKSLSKISDNVNDERLMILNMCNCIDECIYYYANYENCIREECERGI